jgi:hypothetical protein
MSKPCTNETPCLHPTDRGAHSPVCQKLTAQGAKPRATRPPLQPAKLSPPALDVAKGDGKIGCGCAKVHVPDRKTPRDVDGIRHVYGNPCRPVPERAGRAGDQALPTPGAQSVFAEVRRRLDEREAIGIKRYGVSLQTFNGRDAFRDLEDELLDGLNYATQARMEHRAVVTALVALAGYYRTGLPTPAVTAAVELAEKLEPSP